MNRRAPPGSWRRWLSESHLLLVMAFTLVFMALHSPGFLAPGNLLNLLSYVSINGILAVGMTLLMISREFDISIGSVVVLAGVVAIRLIDEVGAHWAMVAGMSVGVGTGAFNGFLVVRLGINSFIATLGSMVIFQGLAFALTDMRSIATESASFQWLGAGSWLGVSLPVLYFAALSLIIWFVSRFTLLGKHAYAIGGREEACRLMGIPVERQKFVFFVITGAAAAFAGVILASRLNSASAVFGENVALVVIASIVIGGVHLSGGSGTVAGVVQGVLLLGLVENATIYLGFSDYYQKMLRALILLGVVLFDVLNTRYGNFKSQRELQRMETQSV